MVDTSMERNYKHGKKFDQNRAIVHGFWPENEKFDFDKYYHAITSYAEQNGTNFSFIAPSTEEQKGHKN